MANTIKAFLKFRSIQFSRYWICTNDFFCLYWAFNYKLIIPISKTIVVVIITRCHTDLWWLTLWVILMIGLITIAQLTAFARGRAIINQIDSNYTQHISHLGILFIQRYSGIKIVSRRQKVFVMHKLCTKGEWTSDWK